MTNYEKVINGLNSHILAVMLMGECPFPKADFCKFPNKIDAIRNWLEQEVEE